MHVGMNRHDHNDGRETRRVPHARGDEPDGLYAMGCVVRSSPCTWG